MSCQIADEPGVCFGAWSLWQGGACHCTSVSELDDLCGIGAEVGGGERRGEEGGATQPRHVGPRERAICIMS